MSHSTPRRRSPVLACLAALSFAGAAQAAELTLYEHPHFTGAQLTLRGWTSNISASASTTGTSSLVVDSGRWEVCTDADFKGRCVILTRGEYPTSTGSSTTASARRARSAATATGAAPTADRGDRGAISCSAGASPACNIVLEGNAAALARSSFDDRASSVVVTRGTWELSPDFRGDCRPTLRVAMPSSARAWRARCRQPAWSAAARCPVVISPGHPLPAEGLARAILYSERAGRREPRPLRTSERSRTIHFSDLAASMVVESGPGSPAATRISAATEGSSARAATTTTRRRTSCAGCRRSGPAAACVAQPPPATPPRSAGVELFSDADFRGDRVAVDGPITDLTRSNFNDRTESVIVHAGTWEICSDAGFGGSCALFKPGNYPRIGGLARHVSSVRRVQ
jgi:hypothetical protein